MEFIFALILLFLCFICLENPVMIYVLIKACGSQSRMILMLEEKIGVQ